MSFVRVIAGAATAVVLALALTPASARPCDDDNPRCSPAGGQIAPMKLEEFMRADKPAGVSRRVSHRKMKRATTVARAKKTAPTVAPPPTVAERSEPAIPVAEQIQWPPPANSINEAASGQTNAAEAAEPAQVV